MIIEKVTPSKETLDSEWLVLIAMAKELGISKDEVRAYLQQHIEEPCAVS